MDQFTKKFLISLIWDTWIAALVNFPEPFITQSWLY